MADYIEREALQARLERKKSGPVNKRYTEGWNDAILMAKSMVHKAAAADVAPVIRGSWNLLRHDKFSDVYQCSECGRKVSLTHGRDVLEQFPYCHCGAKMEDAPCPEHQP